MPRCPRPFPPSPLRRNRIDRRSSGASPVAGVSDVESFGLCLGQLVESSCDLAEVERVMRSPGGEDVTGSNAPERRVRLLDVEVVVGALGRWAPLLHRRHASEQPRLEPFEGGRRGRRSGSPAPPRGVGKHSTGPESRASGPRLNRARYDGSRAMGPATRVTLGPRPWALLGKWALFVWAGSAARCGDMGGWGRRWRRSCLLR